jgi:hypothetical protein
MENKLKINTYHVGQIITSHPRWYIVPLTIFFYAAASAPMLITPNGRHQKNGENQSCVRDFTVVALTIFQLNYCFPGEPTRQHLLPQTEFHPSCTSAHTTTLRSSGDSEKTVRNYRVFAILQLSRSPFFSIKLLIRGKRAIRDIAAHWPALAPPPAPPAFLC